jgi:ferredoxin
MQISHKVVLHFPPRQTGQPVVWRLSKDFNLMFNILRASISPDDQGTMLLDLQGTEQDYQRAMEYLTGLGIRLQPLSKDIRRDDDKCTHCGACVTACPPHALAMAHPNMEVTFDPDLCIGCEACIKLCPVRAMELRF